MKPIFRYTDGNELYNAFIKEYEKNQVVELDRSLRNLNKILQFQIMKEK